MDNVDKKEILGQELDASLSLNVTKLSSKIIDSNIEWKQLPRNVRHCEDEALLKPFKEIYFDAKILQVDGPAMIELNHTGNVVPLYPCTGCSIAEKKNKRFYQLTGLAEDHIYPLPRRNLWLRIEKKCILLFLFESKEDRDKDPVLP
ncbi:hypothetical protein V8C35DRAFT_299433 [Trichoderma chlorosporum]